MLQDLRHAFRTLLKTPGFLVVAILTLALGIGANTAMFSVVKAVLLARLPYPNPERTVQLWETAEQGRHMHVSGPNFRDWREQSRAFDAMATTASDEVVITGDFSARKVRFDLVSRDFFRAVGVAPLRGRSFVDAEHKPGGALAAVLSYDLWQSAFGGDPQAVGKIVRANGMALTVVGIMPTGFDFPQRAQLWVPSEFFPDESTRSAHNYEVVGRLKPGVSIEAAQADMNTIAGRLSKQYIDDKDRGIRVVPLYDEITGPMRPALLILLGAVGLVLLIACVNIANLQMVRASSRIKELALRAALGARRGRIIRQLLTESLLVSIGGGAAGVVIAFWATELLRSRIPANIPRIENIRIDGEILAFTLALAVVCGLLFGILPALSASQTDVSEALKEGSGKNTMTGARRRLGGALVIGEIAMATVLMAGAALLIESFWKLSNVDPGFQSNHIVTAPVTWPMSEAEDPNAKRVAAMNRLLLERVRAIPGAESAAITNTLPIQSGGPDGSFEIEGRALPSNPHDFPDAWYRTVSTGYFETMKVPLFRGRAFSREDERESAPQVAVVNQAFVREFFPNQDALGQRIRFFGFDEKPQFLQIVGIVHDTRSLGLGRAPNSEVFANSFQHAVGSREVTLVVRGPAAIASSVRRAIQSIDRNVPLEFQSMDDVIAESIARQRFQTALLALFATLALVLSAIGIYGVLSYTVDRRTAELGIRMALGADRLRILSMVLREGALMIGLGLASGVGGALLLTRTLTAFLYGVKPTNLTAYAAIAVLLCLTGFAACLVPARRASNTDPMVALRYE